MMIRQTLLAGAAPIAAIVLGGAGPAASPLTTLYAHPSQPDLSGLWLVTGSFDFAPDQALPVL